MTEAFLAANEKMYTQMHREEALQDEIDGLASLEFVGEGEARRAINVNEGCAVSFIEGVLFKHSVRGHADEVQAKTALLRLYLLFEDNTITLKEILQRIEKKAKAIQNKGIVDTWAHVVENMMTKLAETFSKLGTWAADHREPTEKNGYVQWKHNCVPAIRSLCGEIREEARKLNILNDKPDFDADVSRRTGGRGTSDVYGNILNMHHANDSSTRAARAWLLCSRRYIATEPPRPLLTT